MLRASSHACSLRMSQHYGQGVALFVTRILKIWRHLHIFEAIQEFGMGRPEPRAKGVAIGIAIATPIAGRSGRATHYCFRLAKKITKARPHQVSVSRAGESGQTLKSALKKILPKTESIK